MYFLLYSAVSICILCMVYLYIVHLFIGILCSPYFAVFLCYYFLWYYRIYYIPYYMIYTIFMIYIFYDMLYRALPYHSIRLSNALCMHVVQNGKKPFDGLIGFGQLAICFFQKFMVSGHTKIQKGHWLKILTIFNEYLIISKIYILILYFYI